MVEFYKYGSEVNVIAEEAVNRFVSAVFRDFEGEGRRTEILARTCHNRDGSFYEEYVRPVFNENACEVHFLDYTDAFFECCDAADRILHSRGWLV